MTSSIGHLRSSKAAESHSEKMFELFGQIFRPHPWHGISAGQNAPGVVTAFVECVPGDPIKYECDKTNGASRCRRRR